MLTTTRTTAKTTDEASLPVSLQQAKLHLRIASDDLDEAVSLNLHAAIDYCERVTARVLRVSHTVVQSYSQWPCSPLRSDWQPARSITSVTYYDADNAQQTVSSSDYRLIQGNAGAILEFDQDYTYPTLYDRSDAVQVTYLAGYASMADVPATAKKAILLKLKLDWGDTPPAELVCIERSLAYELASFDTGTYR